MRTIRWLGTLSFASLTPGMLGAQVKISSELSCAKCAVVLERVNELDPAEISNEPFAIARGSGGEVYYSDVKARRIKVFSPSGEFVRSIGRDGGGPGEFRMVRNILIAADQSLHVIDPSLSRRSVFDRNGGYLRSNTIPLSPGGMGRPAVMLKDGRLLISAVLQDPNAVGFAVQAVDQGGKRIALLEEADFSSRQQWRHKRSLSPSGDGGAWIAAPYAFQFRKYDRNLKLVSTYTREADWLPPLPDAGGGPSDGVYDRPPTPYINTIWEDSEGLLWIQYLVPDPRWRPAPTSNEARLRKLSLESLIERPRYESIIEAIDPRSARVVSRLRSPKMPIWPISSGYFADFDESSGGEPQLTIARVLLKR